MNARNDVAKNSVKENSLPCNHVWIKQNTVWTDGDCICEKCEARMEKCARTGNVEIYGGKFYKWNNDEKNYKRNVLVIKKREKGFE